MISLDKKDIQILSVLQRDGRITKTALSEQIFLSPTP
jgi:Lrp/AsnC family transcriptional regulator of ectoine degradation